MNDDVSRNGTVTVEVTGCGYRQEFAGGEQPADEASLPPYQPEL